MSAITNVSEEKILSVGEEVLQWAESSWLLDKVCKNEIPKEGEQFNYEYFRSCLRTKIDETIKNRLLKITIL